MSILFLVLRHVVLGPEMWPITLEARFETWALRTRARWNWARLFETILSKYSGHTLNSIPSRKVGFRFTENLDPMTPPSDDRFDSEPITHFWGIRGSMCWGGGIVPLGLSLRYTGIGITRPTQPPLW